jgi:hypothetical protein
MHRWGYAPTVQTLAEGLLGGASSPADLRDIIARTPPVRLVEPFVCLGGYEDLIEKSQVRQRTDRLVNGHAKAVAKRFATLLARSCPFVECVALSGSVASGGFVPSDDIDLDLFVRDGTKYITYALCLLFGSFFALRYRAGGRIRKIICINVIWTREQSQPFERRDIDLAFELLRCQPLVGAGHFREVIRRNAWVAEHFPQVARDSGVEVPQPGRNPLGWFFGWIVGHPRILSATERTGRFLSFAVYRTVHWMRRRDRAAVERFEFLTRAKYPYEVFQD